MSGKRKSSAEAAPSGEKQTADSGDDKAASTSDLSSTLRLSTPKLKKHKVQKAAETPMNDGTTQSDVVEAKDRNFRGPVNVPLVQLLPPKSSRAIRDVRPEHVKTLKDDFSDVDPKANTIRLYGNVICDEDLKPSEIQSNISKQALKVEIIDGSHRYAALKSLIEDTLVAGSEATKWTWLSEVQGITYCNLTDQEARFVARKGNTENEKSRSNTIYELLKGYRRINFEHFCLNETDELPEFTKQDAEIINQKVVAENPDITKSIKNVYKHFSWLSRAPQSVWKVVLEFTELAETNQITHIRREKTEYAGGGGATVKTDPPSALKNLSTSAANLVKFAIGKEKDENLKYMKLKEILLNVIERRDFRVHKENPEASNEKQQDSEKASKDGPGEGEASVGGRQGDRAGKTKSPERKEVGVQVVVVDGELDESVKGTCTKSKTSETREKAAQTDLEAKDCNVLEESENLMAEVAQLKEVSRFLQMEHSAVMATEPLGRVFIDKDRTLYLGGNMDVKNKQVLSVKVMGSFIDGDGELYGPLERTTNVNRDVLFFVGKAESVKHSRGKYSLTAETIEVLREFYAA